LADINNVKLGDIQVNKIYVGDQLNWIYEEPDTTAPITTLYPNPTDVLLTHYAGQQVWFEVNETCDTYYTLDGTTPTTASTLFTEPFTLNETTTIKYFSVDLAGNTESVKTTVFDIAGAVPFTSISPASTIQNTIPFTVSLSATNNPTAIYYKLGATGTQQTYTAPFQVTQSSAGVNSTNIKVTYWSVNANGTETEKIITYDTSGAMPSQPIVEVTNGVNEVTLDWLPTENTTSYTVFRSDIQGQRGTILLPSQYQTATTYTDTTAIGGNTYYYTVQAGTYNRINDSVQITAQPIASGGTQIVNRTLKPSAIWSTNMTPNNVTYLQDSPDSVDLNNLVPTSTTVAPYAELYFGKLTNAVLVGTQKIRLSYVDDVNWVGLYIDILENGVVKQSFSASPTYNGYSNLVAEFDFDASIITDKTGTNVAIMVRGVLFNGLTIKSLRAVEWVATVEEGGEPQVTSNWRYIKFIGHGDDTGAGTTRLVEIKANGGGTNYLYQKLPMAGYVAPNTGGGVEEVTDNITAMAGFPIWWTGDSIPTLVYDLGAEIALDNLQVWMYSTANAPRQTRFHLQVSNNNTTWVDVANFTNNTEIQDPTAGWTFPAPLN
jgi:hypothetical protein